MTPKSDSHRADVCLILEGTYPYVAGGVSNWADDLIRAQDHLQFHLMALLPPSTTPVFKYELPDNVSGVSIVTVQGLPAGDADIEGLPGILDRIRTPLNHLESRGHLSDLEDILNVLTPYRRRLGRKLLLDSRPAWDMMLRTYLETLPWCSFLDFFWSWRALLGGLYSVLLEDLPEADVYHAVSTGYAGVIAARASIEKKRPALLTEHGIYTNERRIELAMADWLYEKPTDTLQVEHTARDIKDLWVDTFVAYSHVCYEAVQEIITLYEGNQRFELQDGAPEEKLRIVPNGMDLNRFANLTRDSNHPPRIALIGRVVPIKDIKTFIRAAGILRERIPDLDALIMGPMDEDKDYFEECETLVGQLRLENTVTFTGRVRLEDYLATIDVVVLTSISEAQPLVILEAGSFGTPVVATDVGACREMIMGASTESPRLGPGGAVTGLANPFETAQALFRLLTDSAWYEECSENLRNRIHQYYNKDEVDRTYREIYETYAKMDVGQDVGTGV